MPCFFLLFLLDNLVFFFCFSALSPISARLSWCARFFFFRATTMSASSCRRQVQRGRLVVVASSAKKKKKRTEGEASTAVFPSWAMARNGSRITKNEGHDCVQIVKGRQGAKGWLTKIEIEYMFRVVRHRDSGRKANHLSSSNGAQTCCTTCWYGFLNEWSDNFFF